MKPNLIALLAAGLLTSASAQPPTVAFVNPAPSVGNFGQYPHDGPWVNGLDFRVVASTQVLSLGAYDSGQDGVFYRPVTVAIFDVQSGLAVTPEVEFSTSDPGSLSDGSRFKPIVPVTLNPGIYSVVAAYYGWDIGSGEPFIDVWWGKASGIPVFQDGSGGASPSQRTGYRFDFGTAFHLPTDATWNFPTPVFGSGTFEFEGLLAPYLTPLSYGGSAPPPGVPEPSTYSLVFSLGLLGLAAWRRVNA